MKWLPKTRWQKGLLGVALLLALGLASAWAVPLPARLSAGDSRVVFFRDDSVAYAFASSDGRWRLPVDVRRIDARYLDALIRYEDRRFYHHPGVDPAAVARAIWQNVTAGRRRSGASTLTMQLTRMLEPRPRTLGSKLVETLRSLQLELRLSKAQILTAYLRFLPYGGNLEGVETASQRFFGHDAHALSTSEILTLLAVPQHPGRRAPAPAHRGALLAAMARVGDRLEVSPLEPISAVDRLHPFAQLAPHAAFWLRAHHPESMELHTTLDRSAQLTVECLLSGRRNSFARDGIFNGAVAVIDQRRGEVRALAGNLDFYDGDHHGQIVGFATPRSPGSTLKPFLYAQALDLGLVEPDQLLEDVPQRWGSYTPSNYDGGYRGLVRAEEALSRSLNTVFLRLAADVGVERFVALASRLGLQRVAAAKSMGLSVVLGSVEVSPLELTAAYAALANDGIYRAPRLLRSEPQSTEVRVFSAGAAWLTRRALSRKGRPDSPARLVDPTLFWKTGTSFGQRDAWSMGAAGDVTVGVWVGNFDRRASTALVGSKAAGPLLFEVLDALRGLPSAVEPAPPDLRTVEVCAYSGYRAGPSCDHRTTVLVTAAGAGQRAVPCPFHATVEVDAQSGQRLSGRCGKSYTSHRVKMAHVLVLPAEVERVYRGPLDEAVPFAPGCAPPPESVKEGHASRPVITSPSARQTLVWVEGVAHQAVPLEVSGVPAQHAVRWFVDGKLLATAPSGQRVLWQPDPGDHEIVVSAALGPKAEARRHVHVDRL